MKVQLESYKLKDRRGIKIQSEGDEEKEILTNIWEKKGRPVAFTREEDDSVSIVFAPSAEE